MKIKTTGLGIKTAPSPPVSPVESSVAAPLPAPRPKRRCCSSYTCCDWILLAILILGGFAIVAGMVLSQFVENFEGEYYGEGRHHSPQYKPARCKVSEIVKVGEVCCGGKPCSTCEAGLRNTKHAKEWVKYMDGPSETYAEEEDHFWADMVDWGMEEAENMRHEKMEAFEKKEHEMEEWMKGKNPHMEDESKESREEHDRAKRSWGEEIKSFECFKVLINAEVQEGHHPHRGAPSSEEGYGSSGRDSSSSEESSQESSHEKSHEEWGKEDDMKEEHRRAKRGFHGGRRPGSHEGGRSSSEEGHHPNPEHHGDDSMEDREDMRQIDPMPEEREGEMKENHEYGIVAVVNESRAEQNIYTVMYYDSVYTMENFGQCSYSGCGRRGCKNTADVEEKMKKWQARLENGEQFQCSYELPQEFHDMPEEQHHRHVHMRILKLAVPLILLIVFIVFIVRRIRACMHVRHQRCSRTPATPQQQYVVPVEPETKMTKEEEANLPPTAPQQVWTSNDDLPPKYDEPMSTDDAQAVIKAWAADNDDALKGKDEDAKA